MRWDKMRWDEARSASTYNRNRLEINRTWSWVCSVKIISTSEVNFVQVWSWKYEIQSGDIFIAVHFSDEMQWLFWNVTKQCHLMTTVCVIESSQQMNDLLK